MKAITLTQPWATLVAVGAKRYETRSWSTTYRGPLAIHAAKGMPRWARYFMAEDPCRTALLEAALTPAIAFAPPRGVIVAICDLTGCTDAAWIKSMNWRLEGSKEPNPALINEWAFGDFSEGRYAWRLENVRRLPEPIPTKGALGLWEWNDAYPFGDDAALCLKCGHYAVRGYQQDGFGRCAWCGERGLCRHEIEAGR